jgi:Cu-processing system permease protein
MIRLQVLKLLLKRDLKSITEFPRLELIILPALLIFVVFSQIIAWSWMGPDIIADRPQILIQSIIENSRLIFTYPIVIVFIPMIIADIITTEFEKGNLLMLISYPVKRSEILISKFVSVFSVSWVVIFFTSLAGVLVVYKNHAMYPPLALIAALLVSTALLCFLVCSVSTLISTVVNHTVVAAMGSLMILLVWPMIVNVFSWQLKLSGLMALSYTGAVPELIDLLTLKLGNSEIPLISVISAIMQFLLASIFLLLSHVVLNRKEFK